MRGFVCSFVCSFVCGLVCACESKLAIELGKLHQGAQDHARSGTGLTAGAARAVGHGNLDDPKVGSAGADEDFGIHEGADRFDRNGLEDLAAEDLEGAIDVSHGKVEELADEEAPDRGDQTPGQGVATGSAVAGDDVGGRSTAPIPAGSILRALLKALLKVLLKVLLKAIEQLGDLGEFELKIRIAEENEIAAGLAQAGPKCCAVALVGRVMNAANARVAIAPLFEHARTVIP